jgi:hypothetical protein
MVNAALFKGPGSIPAAVHEQHHSALTLHKVGEAPVRVKASLDI